jgi:ABC-type uncharacterized transport system substrate-binding protein
VGQHLAGVLHQHAQQLVFLGRQLHLLKQVRDSARSLGLGFETARVSAEDELDGVFGTWARQGVGALLVGNDPGMTLWTERVVAPALRHAMPTMFNVRSYVEAGGLMSYDSSITDSFRQVGAYVGRILKGESPPISRSWRQPSLNSFSISRRQERLAATFR